MSRARGRHPGDRLSSSSVAKISQGKNLVEGKNLVVVVVGKTTTCARTHSSESESSGLRFPTLQPTTSKKRKSGNETMKTGCWDAGDSEGCLLHRRRFVMGAATTELK